MLKYLITVLLITCSLVTTNSYSIQPSLKVAKFVSKPSKQNLCLAWVVENEAGGESLLGKRAVLDVVHTRMLKRNLTACQVISQKGQFSGFNKNCLRKVSLSTLHSYDKVVKVRPVVKGAEYFHNDLVKPAWIVKMRIVRKVGAHTFYKLRK